jgi:hypothetical protein
MKKLTEVQKAARLLGKRGGKETLERYGANKLREWGNKPCHQGKKRGRPEKPKDQLSRSGRYARDRRDRERKLAKGGK